MNESVMLSELYQHMVWADSVIWDRVLKSDKAQDDERIKELLYHTHLTQHAFLRVWRGMPMEFPRSASSKDLMSLMRWGIEYHSAIPAVLKDLVDSDLDRSIAVPWSSRLTKKLGREPAEATLRHTIIQVSVHSIHHRGQICFRLRELEVEPPTTDFIGWIWLGKPEAHWPDISRKK